MVVYFLLCYVWLVLGLKYLLLMIEFFCHLLCRLVSFFVFQLLVWPITKYSQQLLITIPLVCAIAYGRIPQPVPSPSSCLPLSRVFSTNASFLLYDKLFYNNNMKITNKNYNKDNNYNNYKQKENNNNNNNKNNNNQNNNNY